MKRHLRPSRVTRTSAAAATAAAALVLGGCAATSQQATLLHYDPADGVSADVGPINLQDVLLVSAGEGQAARMHGLALNASNQSVQLQISTGQGSPVSVTLPANQAVRLDGQPSGDSTATSGPVAFAQYPGRPGDTLPLQFSTSGAGQVTVNTPILLNQYPYGTASVQHPTASSPTDAEGGGGH